MKKILLTSAAVLTLATSSTYAAEGMFYVKGQVGWDKLDKLKFNKDVKLKSSNNVFLGLGVGYYIMDNVRADLTFDHYVNPNHKGSSTMMVEDDNNGIITEVNAKANFKIKSQADTFMINGFVDLFDVSVAKIFAGAGVGMSMISSKVTGTIPPFTLPDGSTDSATMDVVKYKKKNNFAYALHLGVSTEFALGVSGELTYSYRDMGKFKTPKDGPSLGAFKGHHVAAGVRFDI
jgi:opacity protein-like surface antigen